MNNLQSNERHLADKLRNVPVPDVDQSWEQMKKLLDRDKPEGAGWGGNRKWWWMGITAGVIMLSVWLTQQLNESKGEQPVVNNSMGNSTPGQGNTNATVASTNNNNKTSVKDIDQNNTQAANNNSSASVNNTQSQQPVIVQNNPSTTTANNNEQPVADKKSDQVVTTSPGRSGSVTRPRNIADIIASNTRSGKGTSGRKSADVYAADHLSDVNKTSSVNDRNAQFVLNNNKPDLSQNNMSPQQGKAVVTSASLSGTDVAITNDPVAADLNSTEEIVTLKYAKDAVVSRAPLTSPEAVFNMAEAKSAYAYAVYKKTDRESRRQLRQQYMKDDNRKMSRSKLRGNFGEKDHEITFAAGLSVPQSFAVGGQQSSSYNANAKPGRLPDYLPAPFFQYHLNPRLFLQTELHFQSPQYTQRLLLSQQTVGTNPNAFAQNSVYLEKLYYFNVPFNVYYSPARNLFIGGGLQYSSLLSGVASYEEKRTLGTTQTFNSVTRQFKDDSLAAKFTPSEWRYQFDANYYFKRFTLGLRYNQAMKDFISLQVNSALPPTQDRNQAFLLYLRFNIWEERKKD